MRTFSTFTPTLGAIHSLSVPNTKMGSGSVCKRVDRAFTPKMATILDDSYEASVIVFAHGRGHCLFIQNFDNKLTPLPIPGGWSRANLTCDLIKEGDKEIHVSPLPGFENIGSYYPMRKGFPSPSSTRQSKANGMENEGDNLNKYSKRGLLRGDGVA